jgi:hypothetical protein
VPRAEIIVTRVSVSATFDFAEFISAVDSERRARGMRWYDLADALWEQSADLNAHRNDHPL